MGQYCRAGACAPGADAALWSTLSIPPALLPASEEDKGVVSAVTAVLAPLLAANPAAALLKGPLDPDGPPLADWAAAVVAEFPDVSVSQTPAVETAASTPLPNDGDSDTAVDDGAASAAGEDAAATPRPRRPPLGRLPLLWILLLLPPPPFSSSCLTPHLLQPPCL